MTPLRKRSGFSANARANAPRWLPKAPSEPLAVRPPACPVQTPNDFYAGRGFGPATPEVILLSKDGLPPVDGTPTAIEAGRHWKYREMAVAARSKDGENSGEMARCGATPFRCQLKQTVPWSGS